MHAHNDYLAVSTNAEINKAGMRSQRLLHYLGWTRSREARFWQRVKQLVEEATEMPINEADTVYAETQAVILKQT
jgi:hypothetical protein